MADKTRKGPSADAKASPFRREPAKLGELPMTGRTRWNHWWHYKPVDRVPHFEFGYWAEVYEVWHAQGLPPEVTDEGKANRLFGFDERHGVPVSVGMVPGFEWKVIEETETRKLIQDGDGATCEVRKDGRSSIPHYLRHGLQTRQDWEKTYKWRLEKQNSRRFPSAERWDELKKGWANRDYPLGVHCGSLFGVIRNWMGMENACMAVIDDTAWMEEMMETLCEVAVYVVERVAREVPLDYATFWEDMSFKSGPLISPSYFKRLMVPRYERITEVLRKHGVDVVYLDSDGNINQLAPLWLEAGVNCMFPLEFACGSDPVKLRREYGRDMLLMGGVDKKQLMRDRKTIDGMLDYLRPLVEDGGYIPHVDHRCPPDVPYANYLYYLDRKKKVLLGM